MMWLLLLLLFCKYCLLFFNHISGRARGTSGTFFFFFFVKITGAGYSVVYSCVTDIAHFYLCNNSI